MPPKCGYWWNFPPLRKLLMLIESTRIENNCAQQSNCRVNCQKWIFNEVEQIVIRFDTETKWLCLTKSDTNAKLKAEFRRYEKQS